jgi:CheY-like chemotaxis protein
MLGLPAPNQNGKPENGENTLPIPQAAQDSQTVLVIDDEVALLAIIADVLEEGGYKVLTVPDGPAGLDIVRSQQPIDLLITDIRLPKGMNGPEVAQAARMTRPQLKILFMTGYAGSALDGASPLTAGMEMMTKPFDLMGLPDRVRRLIES